MVFRSLYYVAKSVARGENPDVATYLAEGEKLFGLNQNGLRTVSALGDRSERTKQLAIAAKVENVENLVTESDIILSILVPSAATQIAKQAVAIQKVGKNILYVDANAISPERVKAIAPIIGGQFVDASIIRPPPRQPKRTRIYASSQKAELFAKLRDYGLDIRVIGSEIGQASGLKMCYAALTKGLTAISTELLIAAHRLNLDAELWQEISTSQKELWFFRTCYAKYEFIYPTTHINKGFYCF
jgi:3-hydroxyisobutyrate dehydrogenase-like beta-hydroxyacid dehydrogenase